MQPYDFHDFLDNGHFDFRENFKNHIKVEFAKIQAITLVIIHANFPRNDNLSLKIFEISRYSAYLKFFSNLKFHFEI